MAGYPEGFHTVWTDAQRHAWHAAEGKAYDAAQAQARADAQREKKTRPTVAYDASLPTEAPGGSGEHDAVEVISLKARRDRKNPASRAPALDDRPSEFSDDAIALRFAERHADDLRYVAEWGKWLRYDGCRWQIDKTRNAYDLVRRICREIAAECSEPRVATAVSSGKTIATVERMAQADRRIAATVDQWDADPWLPNTPGGVVDLRTGETQDHRAGEYMTKITGAGDAKGDCHRFLDFLDRITAGDQELIAYIRRLFGYALTGVTREHALFFGYGTGANGKSVLLSTVAGLMGDYHKTAPIETFTVSYGDRHSTDIAGLIGARLVTASETEEGRHWAEAKIKQLTGGDRVSARFMRQDFFEFTPAFKLFIAGNHQPSLRSVDEAIRRRFHMTPFAVTIPPDERDGELTEKLKAEWPGILRWLIEGCLEWQAEGLRQPQAVQTATADYLEAEDTFAAWIGDRCERRATAWEGSTDLFASWTNWATAAGETIGSQKNFSQKLKSKHFVIKKGIAGNGFLGLRIRSRDTDIERYQ